MNTDTVLALICGSCVRWLGEIFDLNHRTLYFLTLKFVRRLRETTTYLLPSRSLQQRHQSTEIMLKNYPRINVIFRMNRL